MIGKIDNPRRAGVWLFLLITFGWSWGIAAAMHLSAVSYTHLTLPTKA